MATDIKSGLNHQSGLPKFEIFPTPIKSPSDTKDYKVIRLKNGLTACLVCDQQRTTPQHENEISPDQKTAATSLTINVGSFSDPQSVPGMAHFLEHMVLMGSEKYPDETDFESFISSREGSYCGITDCESTTFYFECPEKHFVESLDKFAQFFNSPLMKKDSVESVLEAIESEFNTSLTSDQDRDQQFVANFIKKDIPINTFTLGNTRTLKDNISEDELYERLYEFRKRYYSAHQMTLAIQAPYPMDVLEQLVLEHFDQVPTNNLQSDNLRRFTDIFETSAFTKLYYIDTVEEKREVILTWVLPCLYEKYKSKPHWYLVDLLEREGKGSLLYYLTKKAWALNLTAGREGSTKRSSVSNSLYALWPLRIELTEEGLKHLNEVIATVFSYINMLRKLGPQERIFNEMKTIAETSFKFPPEMQETPVVRELSEVMHLFPSKDYLTGYNLYFEYDPATIQMILDSLVPDKMNIIVRHIDLPEGISYDKEEKWFGIKYAEQEISKEWMERWQHAPHLSDFSLPPANQFLPKDFTVLPDEDNHPDYPQKILHTDLVELWHRRDQKFKLPRTYYTIACFNPIVVKSAFNLVLMELYAELLKTMLKDDLYPAEAINFSHLIYSNDEGITIKVSGYNESIHLVLELITKFIIEFNVRLTEDIFDAVKTNLVTDYYDRLLEADNLNMEMIDSLLIQSYYSWVDRYKASFMVTLGDIKQFAVDFFACSYVKALVQGNVTKDQAINVVNTFVSTLNFNAFDYGTYPKFRVVQLPTGESSCAVESLNKTDSTSVVTNYYQLGPFNMRDSVSSQILMMIIEKPIFDALCTQEELGDSADCGYTDTSDIVSFRISVKTQAANYSTEYVKSRIDEFLKKINELLSNMPVQEFQSVKEDLIKRLVGPKDVMLSEEIFRNWIEIIGDSYMFDRKKKQIEQVKQLELSDLLNWWNHISGENFRKISFQVVGHTKIPEQETRESDTKWPAVSIKFLEIEERSSRETNFIKDIKEYQDSLYLFPVITQQREQ